MMRRLPRYARQHRSFFVAPRAFAAAAALAAGVAACDANGPGASAAAA
ncbi:cytochrome-c peroxidase, partial [Burkholderia pseudomallei]|nr:cytochrome-c peroxidase [Burkholderia pseudomallei]